ncbi:CDP-alcohol phosphatidyltransferase family protein [Oceaniglobus trochenteri]|uniref:CDP-alcohol phosphatidyltransferase family protein n=1 Tax=Oceaniglobus trochenteri TaxID=2763260 RepID=UPI001CFFE2EE|nr:CDP-alcohol phosphatidyltransferase family protein [Oceaniglobus trochenteri]
MTEEQPAARRPLASRQTGWARAAASWLARTPLTPNHISMLGILFAALAGLALAASAWCDGAARPALLVAAMIGIQLRLLCNLLDGMVAVEGGKGAADGYFWNEAPDRLSDILILVGAGLGAGLPILGWAAATFAVLTAYIRELGHAAGLAPDFAGPLGKPQRMALFTLAALLAMFEPVLGLTQGAILALALWIAIAGTVLTALRRSARQIAALRSWKG